MKWLAVVSLVLIAAYLLLRWGIRPIRYRDLTSKDFPRFTDSLISQGGDGALLFIRHDGSERFVQFAKHLSPMPTIHFGFPDAPWSRNYFSTVHDSLCAADFRCYERSTPDTADVPRFLCIDEINSPTEATEIARVAFSAMGVDDHATYTIHQEGPVSLAEWRRYKLLRNKPKRQTS
jgi:hypothetical protein